ncbi:hypothetical protein Bca101_043272 [Brassica carinata]
MVHAPSPVEREEFPRFTVVDDMISIAEVLHGEPMDYDQLQRTLPNGVPPNLLPHGMPLEVEPLRQIPPFQPIWEDVSDEDQAYWDGVFEAEKNYQLQVQPAPRPTNGSLGLPIGPNLRVTAPPSPTTVLVVEAEETSYTGSSDGLDENHNDLSPAIPISENVANISDALSQGEDTAPIANGNVGPLTQVNNGGSAAVHYKKYIKWPGK